ncbi:Threonine/homoserine efflux transporter RhtA [Roseivivax lentus]|uniref:Threonine/homoserine efflux transporter RhtA n=1 Tax=Roseivivax lentus TaxID=633194 RepID=A0A1N7NMQ2_9RHOB|nr:DMT family transporter [Roseivivax lentus]SIS99713.1 Threonine/homoserine efflux transporter RhtA [Roseivivax lentus]
MFQAVQRPLEGILWMVVTGVCFVMVTALVKALGTRIPPAESAFLRYLLGLVFLIPVWRVLAAARLTRRHWALFSIRGLMHGLGVICWFFAMTRIPIAEVTAMNYLNPVFVSLLAVAFLGERMKAPRILAIVAALLGALIILRPGMRVLDPGHFAMMVTALSFAGGYLLAKILSDELPASVVVAMLSATVTLALLPFALLNWVWPSWGEIGILFAVAFFATAGHYTMTRAFAAAPVTVTQPVIFLQLVWSVLIGAAFFGEPPDPFVIAGGTLIVAAVVFMTWREARANRRRITPAFHATKH